MTTAPQKTPFPNSGYYFMGLILLVIGGFWSSYFSKFFDHTADFSFYFHFHAAVAALWISLVIIQPILIRNKKYKLHKLLGKVSYFVFALIFISVLLLIHSRFAGETKIPGILIFLPFKDLIVLGTAYFIAVRYRKDVQIHARAMITTGLVFIEPAFVRLMSNIFHMGEASYPLTIAFVHSIFLILVILEWKAPKGRWVFPLIWGMYIIIHGIIIFRVPLDPLVAVAKWFLSLPLT